MNVAIRRSSPRRRVPFVSRRLRPNADKCRDDARRTKNLGRTARQFVMPQNLPCQRGEPCRYGSFLETL